MEEKIAKYNRQLEELDEQKCQLNDRVQKLLKDITSLASKIEKAEIEVEKAAQEKMERECQERLKCDIARLKNEQIRAERILHMYNEALKQRCTQFKNCQQGKMCTNN